MIDSLELKTSNELRPGMTLWVHIDISMACKQYVLRGLTNSMILTHFSSISYISAMWSITRYVRRNSLLSYAHSFCRLLCLPYDRWIRTHAVYHWIQSALRVFFPGLVLLARSQAAPRRRTLRYQVRNSSPKGAPVVIYVHGCSPIGTAKTSGINTRHIASSLTYNELAF